MIRVPAGNFSNLGNRLIVPGFAGLLVIATENGAIAGEVTAGGLQRGKMGRRHPHRRLSGVVRSLHRDNLSITHGIEGVAIAP